MSRNDLTPPLALLTLTLAACGDFRPVNTDGGIAFVPVDAGTSDGGTPPRENLGTFATDAGSSGVGLTVASAVLSSYVFDQTPHHLVILFENPAARGEYCAGQQPTGNQQWLYTYLADSYALAGTFTSPTTADLDVPFTDLSYGRASSGSVTLTEGSAGEYVVGSFESSALNDLNGAPVGGGMSGTFQATACPPLPHFEGTGANSASGSAGFAVGGATVYDSSQVASFPYYLVYLTSPDGSAEVCAGAASFGRATEVAILYIPAPSAGLPLGTFDASDGFFVDRFTTDANGDASTLLTSYTASVEVTGNTGSTLVGTYTAKLIGPLGEAQSLSGSFSAPLCP